MVKDAAENIKKGTEIFGESNDQFWKLAKYIKEGGKFPEIILMSDMVLLEGHVRMTAYLLASDTPKPLEMIVGFPKTD